MNRNKTKYSSKEIILMVLVVIPFFASIVFVISYLIYISELCLSPSFSVNFTIVFVIAMVHLSIIYLFSRKMKVDIGLTNINTLKKIVQLFLIIVFFIVSSFLLEVSLKMNLNYLFRNDSIENIEIIVVNKHISHGRATDYYVDFKSNERKFSYKVRKKDYNNYKIGEVFNVEVNRGYFEGYFLLEKLK